MKRHTIFIYTAALLTMLGTALPMSAQNKSFTVNRNDGASQKYSYSQGDRLVLSREDSQGKKHADFVEQQVYVGNDVHNIPLTSIESITFDTQATEDEGKTFVIQESGGKVEYDDITIDFPSGTFISSTKVTVSEVEKGKIDGEDELSKYYKVKFGGGVRKSFNIGVKSPEYADDNALKMQFAMMGFAQSLNQEMMAPNLLDVQYAGGEYVAEVPEMESPDDVGEIDVYFGLRSYEPVDMNDAASTRGNTYLVDYTFTPLLPINPISAYKCITSWIPDAIEEIEKMGFSKYNLDNWPKPIFYRTCILPSGDYGVMVTVPWGKRFGPVLINAGPLLYNTYNENDLRKTLTHETFHYYQQYYDSRPAPVICTDGKESHAKILNEATAVWFERFFGSKLSNQTKEYVSEFLGTMDPEVRDVHDCPDSQIIWADRTQNIGYGMSALLEYLSQKNGASTIKTMWENGFGDPYNPFNTIEKTYKNIFTQSAYKDFVDALACGKIYSTDLTETKRLLDNMIGRRQVHDSIGITTRVIKDEKPVYFTNYAYGYGALVEELTVDAKALEPVLKKQLQFNIEQTAWNVKTWIYTVNEEGVYLVGELDAESGRMDISRTFYRLSDNSFPDVYEYYLVTIPNNFKTEEKILSRIEAKIVQEIPNLTKIGIVLDYYDEEGDLRELRTPDFTDHKEATERSISWLPVDVTMNKENTIATITGEGKLPWRDANGDQYCEVKIELEIKPVEVLVYAIHKLKGSITWIGNAETSSRKIENSANYNFDVECYKMQDEKDINTIKYFTSSAEITYLSEKENIIDKENSEKSSNKTYRMGSKYSPTLTIYLYTDPNTGK